MAWKISWHESAKKNLERLDKSTQRKIISYMKERIAKSDNPRDFGKGLSLDKVGLWRYRIDDYRVICRIIDSEVEVLVVRVGHRKDVYDS